MKTGFLLEKGWGVVFNPAADKTADWVFTHGDSVNLHLNGHADPNVKSPYDGLPVLFGTIGTSPEQNDKAILLLQKGADVNAKEEDGFTPVMYAANKAQTIDSWRDVWRVVHYLLADAHADFTSTTKGAFSLQTIIRKTREDAATGNSTMPPQFDAVVSWLIQHRIDTEPVGHLQPKK